MSSFVDQAKAKASEFAHSVSDKFNELTGGNKEKKMDDNKPIEKSPEKQAQIIDVELDKKSGSASKPKIAEKLEKEGSELLGRRSTLTKEDVNEKLADAEERRSKALEEKITVAKQLEGHGSRSSSPARKSMEEESATKKKGLEEKLASADERRSKMLEARVDKAKELEGHRRSRTQEEQAEADRLNVKGQ